MSRRSTLFIAILTLLASLLVVPALAAAGNTVTVFYKPPRAGPPSTSTTRPTAARGPPSPGVAMAAGLHRLVQQDDRPRHRHRPPGRLQQRLRHLGQQRRQELHPGHRHRHRHGRRRRAPATRAAVPAHAQRPAARRQHAPPSSTTPPTRLDRRSTSTTRPTGGAWTAVPGVADERGRLHRLGEEDRRPGHGHRRCRPTFNNGSGTWDNNNGANYPSPAGTSTVTKAASSPPAPPTRARRCRRTPRRRRSRPRHRHRRPTSRSRWPGPRRPTTAA